MDDVSLQTICRCVVIAKLTYTSSAWWGFASASDLQRLEAFIRRSDRSDFVPANLSTFAELCQNADENLFAAITGDFTMFYITSFRLSLKGLNTTIYVNVHTASQSVMLKQC